MPIYGFHVVIVGIQYLTCIHFIEYLLKSYEFNVKLTEVMNYTSKIILQLM